MSPSSKKIPEWKLERLLLGELPEAEAEALQTRIDAEPAEAARLAALEESNREILAAHPPAEMLREIERRQHLQTVREREAARPKVSRSLLWGLPSLAAAATLALVLLQGDLLGPGKVTVEPFPLEHTTIKGSKARLHVHRQTAEGDEELESGDRARPGDLLQLAYNAAGEAHGLIVSLDGRGTVTIHLAGRGGLHSVPLNASGKTKLDRAYELDDAPDFERFYLFVSKAPFEAEALLDAVKAAGAGPLELEFEAVDHITFEIRKETP